MGSIPMYERAVFKDFFAETITYIDMMNDSTTAAIKNISSTKDWKQVNETKIISGFNCKLLQKRNKHGVLQKIWYTEDISIFDGPEDFCNFPGLVLEFERGGRKITAIEIDKNRYYLFII